jgi:hypothetical protein
MAISKELNDKLLDIFDGPNWGLFSCAADVIDFLFQFDSSNREEAFVTLLVRGKTSTYPPLEWDSKEALHLYAEQIASNWIGSDPWAGSPRAYPGATARARKAVMDLILEDFNNDLEKIRKGLNND